MNNRGYKKNDKNLFIKLLIFCIRNLYEVPYVVSFFIKYLTQQKKNDLIVHFQNFGVQKFPQTLTKKDKKAE